MGLRITLGHSVSDDSDAKELELPVPEGSTLSLTEVAEGLGLPLQDEEGSLLVFVNGELCPPTELLDLRLCDGDHLTLFRMLSGG